MDRRPNLFGLFVSDKDKNTVFQHIGQLSFKQMAFDPKLLQFIK
jgi:hypothetical protein